MPPHDEFLPRDDPEARARAEANSDTPSGFSHFIGEAALGHATENSRRDDQSDAVAWAARGPRNVGGRIRALMQDPRNPGTLYAGSALGGLWKTTNAGDTWTPLPSLRHGSKEVAAPIGAIGICHRAPETLYVGTGEPKRNYSAGYGLFYSADGGGTFEKIAEAFEAPVASPRFERILVDPWEPGRAWCAGPRGLWRSQPGDPPSFGGSADIIDGVPAPNGRQDVTDVAIDFGNRAGATAPATFTVYTAVRGVGVYRATFDRAANDYTVSGGARWARVLAFQGTAPTAAHLAVGRGRIKLALCEGRPNRVYAAFGQDDNSLFNVYRSNNGGGAWAATTAGNFMVELPRTADYAMVLEVHPTNPDLLYVGSVNLYRSTNGGGGWDQVIDWHQYSLGDRAQHADQHAVLFDRSNANNVWIGNDGGISLWDATARPAARWRKRSHGILAAQFYDIAAHPTYPFIYGGGLQDNGTWVSYGGPSWYRLDGGDGGGMAFAVNNPQRFMTSWQGNDGAADGVNRTTLESPNLPVAVFPSPNQPNEHNMLPDVPGTGATPVAALFRHMAVFNVGLLSNFTLADGTVMQGVFGGRLVGHPTRVDHYLVARQGGAHLSTDGSVFNLLTGAGANDPSSINVDVTALTYAAFDPDHEWWIGAGNRQSHPPPPPPPPAPPVALVGAGQIFRTDDAGATWHQVGDAAMADHRIADIAVHPGNASIVAVAVGAFDPQVFVSADKGGSWHEISSRDRDGRRLAQSPVTSLVWDPRGAATTNQPQTLYVGTAVGVYVARDIDLTDANPRPTWRHLNTGMPLVLVQDLDIAVNQGVGGAGPRHILRCATFGRGVFEAELQGTPPVRLLVRSTVIDDGRQYPAAQTFDFDPRLRAPGTGTRTDLAWHQAIDLRLDSPVNFDYGDVFDAAEFDEEFRSGILRIGEDNRVYVQVHNTGARAADGVRVQLLFANAELTAGGDARAPDLDADFWTNYPDPPAGPLWREAGRQMLNGLESGQPRVVAFHWTPPFDLGPNVALLSLLSHDDDRIDFAGQVLDVDEQVHGDTALSRAERRAALRIVRTEGAMFTRDAVDDVGLPGSVAWGGRSNDIVVVPDPAGDPDAEFASRHDRRLGDVVRAGQENRIYVRVFNRRGAQITARVRVLTAAFTDAADPSAWSERGVAEVEADAADPSAWSERGVAEVEVPAHDARFIDPAITWSPTAADDPAPGQDYKAVLVIALLSIVVPAGGAELDPEPDRTTITDLNGFWRFFRNVERSNNAAFRALPYIPA
jgi:photosystem II stability/assembly factor-like uncharacterized protein